MMCARASLLNDKKSPENGKSELIVEFEKYKMFVE